MPVTDTIADYLTRIRNGVNSKKKFVEIPSSNMKVNITKLLKENNFIKDYEVIEDNKQNILKVYLQYIDGEASIKGLKRISTPGLRQYGDTNNLPRVINGLGIAIISTSKGLLTDKQARKEGIGGEIICYVW